MELNKRIQHIATLPSISSSHSEVVPKLLFLYREALIKKDNIENIIRLLCERICGVILRPELIETGKSIIMITLLYGFNT